MMKKAYLVRVTADYYPDVAVEPDDLGGFRLNSIRAHDASEWLDKAKEYCSAIEQAARLTDG